MGIVLPVSYASSGQDKPLLVHNVELLWLRTVYMKSSMNSRKVPWILKVNPRRMPRYDGCYKHCCCGFFFTPHLYRHLRITQRRFHGNYYWVSGDHLGAAGSYSGQETTVEQMTRHVEELTEQLHAIRNIPHTPKTPIQVALTPSSLRKRKLGAPHTERHHSKHCNGAGDIVL